MVIISFSLSSCKKDSLKADVPSYIHIEPFTLNTNYLDEGSESHNITDAWVYVDDNLVGVYELPATFPVLKEGDVELKIYAGIKQNGITNNRIKYPFYNPHTEQVTLVKEEILDITPSTSYHVNTTFAWLEDFENASLSFTHHTNSDTAIKKTTTEVFEGSASGYVFLESSMDFFECISPELSSLPRQGQQVYMEIDAKTNHSVLIGLYGDDDKIGIYYINKGDNWKKIYFDLTESVRSNTVASKFKVFMGFQKSDDIPNPEVYFDNIKLLHY